MNKKHQRSPEEITDRIETELNYLPSTEAVAIASGTVFGAWAAGNQILKDVARMKYLKTKAPQGRDLGEISELQMEEALPGVYYGGRALLNGAPSGLTAALLLTVAYAGAKRAYAGIRNLK